MIVGGCTFNRWRYASWPLVSAGAEDHGFRVGARLWPILLFGFLDVDRSLIEPHRESRSVLIPWESVRGVELRRPNVLSLTLLDGWRLRFGTISGPLDGLADEARAHLPGSPDSREH
ncbi:MAG: hypothetical protein KQH57_14865 [Actinomycetales bacterium]|nr:hypothetical protein [Actinomycetales bacterium]